MELQKPYFMIKVSLARAHNLVDLYLRPQQIKNHFHQKQTLNQLIVQYLEERKRKTLIIGQCSKWDSICRGITSALIYIRSP